MCVLLLQIFILDGNRYDQVFPDGVREGTDSGLDACALLSGSEVGHTKRGLPTMDKKGATKSRLNLKEFLTYIAVPFLFLIYLPADLMRSFIRIRALDAILFS